MKVIEMLKAQGTVDELGIGVIRNVLSDAMFNGITTIMTRAKYFFIVPRILNEYLLERPQKITAEGYLRQEENRIMQQLFEQEDHSGLIGLRIAQANERKPKNQWGEVERKPSTIYWGGLRKYNIYRGDASLANFLRIVERRDWREQLAHLASKAEGDDLDVFHQSPFKLPDQHSNWRDDLGLALTETEANFLKHQIQDTQSNKLIGHLVAREELREKFLKAGEFDELHQDSFLSLLPAEISKVLSTAWCFWQILYGAHIRYNILLHDRHGSDEFKKDKLKDWDEYVAMMETFEWEAFDEFFLWDITHRSGNINRKTKLFIREWIDHMRRRHFEEKDLDELVEIQERNNKGKRSKLRRQNDEQYSEWVGINKLDYRFGTAKTIIKDIAEVERRGNASV